MWPAVKLGNWVKVRFNLGPHKHPHMSGGANPYLTLHLLHFGKWPRRREQIEFATGRMRNVGGLARSRATGYPLGAPAASCNMQQPFCQPIVLFRRTVLPFASPVAGFRSHRTQLNPWPFHSAPNSNSAEYLPPGVANYEVRLD